MAKTSRLHVPPNPILVHKMYNTVLSTSVIGPKLSFIIGVCESVKVINSDKSGPRARIQLCTACPEVAPGAPVRPVFSPGSPSAGRGHCQLRRIQVPTCQCSYRIMISIIILRGLVTRDEAISKVGVSLLGNLRNFFTPWHIVPPHCQWQLYWHPPPPPPPVYAGIMRQKHHLKPY